MAHTEHIVAALKEQVDCYRKLAKLAQLQHQHVQQQQTESLLDVLRSRQQMLDEIARLESIVGPSKREWVSFVQSMAPTDRASAESSVAESRQLLEQITNSDRNDVLLLQQRKLNLGKQINAASAAGQVNRRYAAAAYGSPNSRMDLSS
jgi:uncharacterized protein with von Willebrand factor type A (vWA) domain